MKKGTLKRYEKKVYHGFSQLESGKFPKRRKHEIKTYHSFAAIDPKKFPDQDKVIHRINNITELKFWLDIHIWHYGELISPKDIIGVQYHISKNAEEYDIPDHYGPYGGSWDGLHYRIVADMPLREVITKRKEILNIYKKGIDPTNKQISLKEDYNGLIKQISKVIPAEINENLWRNMALANFITIINSTSKKKRRICAS